MRYLANDFAVRIRKLQYRSPVWTNARHEACVTLAIFQKERRCLIWSFSAEQPLFSAPMRSAKRPDDSCLLVWVSFAFCDCLKDVGDRIIGLIYYGKAFEMALSALVRLNNHRLIFHVFVEAQVPQLVGFPSLLLCPPKIRPPLSLPSLL